MNLRDALPRPGRALGLVLPALLLLLLACAAPAMGADPNAEIATAVPSADADTWAPGEGWRVLYRYTPRLDLQPDQPEWRELAPVAQQVGLALRPDCRGRDAGDDHHLLSDRRSQPPRGASHRAQVVALVGAQPGTALDPGDAVHHPGADGPQHSLRQVRVQAGVR